MLKTGVIRKSVAILTVAMTLTVVGHVSASASAQWANDQFSISGGSGSIEPYYTSGGIIWGNRTADIQGRVGRNYNIEGYTTVYFDAFAGSTKVASTFRSTPNPSGHTDFHFTIGDPTLPGGIDRIRIVLCGNNTDGTHYSCSAQYNEMRD